MWEWDQQESWALKNWCFQNMVLEKTLESSLDSKEIKPINPKGNQPWIFIERTDAEVEAPILWSPDVKSQLIGKDPDAGKDWGQEERGAKGDEMAGLHLWCNVHELGHTLGDGERQGGLTCCSPWDCRVRTYWVAEQQLTFTTALCLTPQTVVLEKTPESSLDSKEIKPVNLKGN